MGRVLVLRMFEEGTGRRSVKWAPPGKTRPGRHREER